MQDYEFNYSQYKKKITPKKVGGMFPLLIIIILLVVLCINLLPRNINQTTFYLVEIDNFPTYSQASTLAQEIQNQGGAGYIHFDGEYRVFVSMYTLESDAEKVKENLNKTFSSSSIYNMSTYKKINTKNLSETQKNSVENYANFCLKSIDEIANLIITLDKHEIDENTLKNRLNSYFVQSKNLSQEVLVSLPKNSTYNVAKEYATNLNNCFEELANFATSCNLKYSLIKLVINYCSFVDSF